MTKFIFVLISFGFLNTCAQQKNNTMKTTINSLDNLTNRSGERPQTGPKIPHLQHTDNSSVELFDELADWLFSLELIEERKTIISVRGARAAWIKEEYPNANLDVLKTGREFTHIHPLDIYGGGSQHLSLKREDCEKVIARGWGEYHPLDYQIYPNKDYGHIMVYAPRNKEELEAIKIITMASYNLVTNQN